MTKLVARPRLFFICCCLLLVPASTDHGGGDKWARCVIDSSTGVSGQDIEGTVTFKQPGGGGDVTVWINLCGFDTEDNKDEHGFHVHENGELGNECKDAGSHFNPEGVVHGAPDDDVRHVGDLGNIKEDDDGRVNTVITDSVIKLYGEHSIIDKAIVVHETFDDMGLGGFSDSNSTGHAGARLGCCTIEMMDSADIMPPQEAKSAQCVIEADSGVTGDDAQPVQGKVSFEQPVGFGDVLITVDLAGFDTQDALNTHGFHIHEFGELTNACTDAGSHFNPEGVEHGAPDDEVRHVGDLGNVVEEADGSVSKVFSDRMIKLSGPHNIMDKAVVVHYTLDDMGLGGFPDSNSTGHAGSRLGCCKIEETDDGTGGATNTHASILMRLLSLLLARPILRLQ